MNFSKLTDKLRNTKLRSRLIASFLVISIFPGIALSIYSGKIYSRSITEKVSSQNQQLLKVLNHDLSNLLDEYNRYISELSMSDAIQDHLIQRSSGLLSDTYPILDRTVTLRSLPHTVYLRDIFILDNSGSLVSSNGYVSDSPEAIQKIIKNTDRVSPRDFVALYEPSYYGSDCIAMCRKIYDNKFLRTHVGYIIIFISMTQLREQFFPLSDIGDEGNLYLFNADGSLICSENTPDSAEIDALGSVISGLDGRSFPDGHTSHVDDPHNLSLYTYNRQYDLYISSVIPVSFLNREINSIRQIIVGITAGILVICLILYLIVYRSIINPIDRMISACSASSGNVRGTNIGDSANDELGYLARTIDDMSENNSRMLREIEDQHRQKRETEIQMLQYQINPHFLFNTLNTLKWMASLNGVDTLSNGISSLSGILRGTLVNKDETASLADEINYLKDYCTIQNLRYAGQFHVSYYLDEASLSYRIPRFLLQPLVENAILHGIKDKKTVLNISVTSAISNNLLNIAVQDDGIGFNPDDIKSPDGQHFTGIGLSNVDERLRLYFGDEHGLRIQSHEGGGTRCYLSIPISVNTEEKK